MPRMLPYVIGALLGLGSPPARACDCSPGGKLCEVIWSHDAVFVGKVIDRARGSATSGAGVLVHFRISEVFRGQVGKEVEIGDGYYGVAGGCVSSFSSGDEFVVYAKWNAQKTLLMTSSCGTRNMA